MNCCAVIWMCLGIVLTATGCGPSTRTVMTPAEYLSNVPLDEQIDQHTVNVKPIGVRENADGQLFVDLQFIGTTENARCVSLEISLFLCGNPGAWLEIFQPSGSRITLPQSRIPRHFGGLPHYVDGIDEKCARVLMPVVVQIGLLHFIHNGTYRVRLHQVRSPTAWAFEDDEESSVHIAESW